MTQRPIRFRAWDKTLKAMYEYSAAIEDLHDDCVLMQFTGLHDKNGKDEWWEKDILKSPDGEIGVIVWSDDEAMFRLMTPDGDIWSMEWHEVIEGGWKRIGNVFENPELLTN